MTQRSNSLPEISTSAGAGVRSKPQTIFIHKLYDMLEDAEINHLIWWSRSNDSFYLLPNEEFSKVLALYFKHTNIASFIRQLNMYGFHKVNDGASEGTSNTWEFKHSNNQFRKGDVDSLKLIKRRASKNINTSQKEVVIPPEADDVDNISAYHQALQYHQLQQSSTIPIDKYLELLNNYNQLKFELSNLYNKFDYFLNDYKLQQKNLIKLIDLLQSKNDLTPFKHYLVHSLSNSIISNDNFNQSNINLSANGAPQPQYYPLNPYYSLKQGVHAQAGAQTRTASVSAPPPHQATSAPHDGHHNTFPPQHHPPPPPPQHQYQPQQVFLAPPNIIPHHPTPSSIPNAVSEPVKRGSKSYSPLSSERKSPNSPKYAYPFPATDAPTPRNSIDQTSAPKSPNPELTPSSLPRSIPSSLNSVASLSSAKQLPSVSELDKTLKYSMVSLLEKRKLSDARLEDLKKARRD